MLEAPPSNPLFPAGQTLAPKACALTPLTHPCTSQCPLLCLHGCTVSQAATLDNDRGTGIHQWTQDTEHVQELYLHWFSEIYIDIDRYIYIYVSVWMCVYVYIYKIHRTNYCWGLHHPGRFWCSGPRVPISDAAGNFMHETWVSPRPDPVKHSLLVWMSNLNFHTWVPENLSSYWIELLFSPWKFHATSKWQAEISHNLKD